jgi:protein-tyrosine-phosphatase
MNKERSNNYPKTVSEFLHKIVSFIIREQPDSTEIFKLLTRAIKNCPINQEALKEAKPYNLIVICDQNQGRSQAEEAILRLIAQTIGLPLNLVSAGVNATPEKYGGKPGPIVTGKLEDLGISMNDATVDQLKESDIDENTIVLALCAKENIPDHVFRAKAVIAGYIKDSFPGSKAPDNKDALDHMIEKTAWLGLRVATRLAEAMEKSDFELFTKGLEDLILTKPSK